MPRQKFLIAGRIPCLHLMSCSFTIWGTDHGVWWKRRAWTVFASCVCVCPHGLSCMDMLVFALIWNTCLVRNVRNIPRNGRNIPRNGRKTKKCTTWGHEFMYNWCTLLKASGMSRDTLSVGLELLRVPTTESMDQQEDLGSAIQAGWYTCIKITMSMLCVMGSWLLFVVRRSLHLLLSCKPNCDLIPQDLYLKRSQWQHQARVTCIMWLLMYFVFVAYLRVL